ncbi:MAG: hypothetical protein V1856_00855 [Candidatus Liptonbacteria bacterium]
MTDLQVVQACLRTRDGFEMLRGALSLSPRCAELFWAALNHVTEENGLLLSGFARAATRTLTSKSLSSFYLNELRKKNLLVRGEKRGDWVITPGAIKQLLARMEEGATSSSSGTSQPQIETAGEAASPKKPRARRKTGPAKTSPTQRTRRAKVCLRSKLMKLTLAQVFEELDTQLQQCDSRIKEWQRRREEVERKRAALCAALAQ